MKNLLILFSLFPVSGNAQGLLQQLLPNGSFTFEVPNDEIQMMMDTSINLPGMQKATSFVNGKKITVEKYDRGSGYQITVKIGYRKIYDCSVIDRTRENQTRYCY
jgi:hypothetical protein